MKSMPVTTRAEDFKGRKIMRFLKNLSLSLLLVGALPMFGAIYMKVEGIKGSVTAAGHEKWIELGSVQLEDGKPLPAALEVELPNVLITSYQTGGGADFVCQPGRRLGDVLIDIDGKRHVLRNARFAKCPASRDGKSTAVLAFGSFPSFRGGVYVGAGDVNGDGATQPNARLIGLGASPIPIRLERLKLNPNGTSATMSLTKIGPGTLTLTATSPTALPKVVLELTNGTKWTFDGLTFSPIGTRSATGGDDLPIETITMNFGKAEGPAAGYNAR